MPRMVSAAAIRVRAGLDTRQQSIAAIGVDGFMQQDALQVHGEPARRMSTDDAGGDIPGAAREYGRPSLRRQVVGECGTENALGATKQGTAGSQAQQAGFDEGLDDVRFARGQLNGGGRIRTYVGRANRFTADLL